MNATLNYTDISSDWMSYLQTLANKESVMPSGAFNYRGYTITPLINHNPYLFHNWDAGPEDSPKRRVGKTVYFVTMEGYVDGTYFKSLAGAKRFIRKCSAPRL